MTSVRIPIATAAPPRAAEQEIDLWALDRAITVIASAHGKPYALALKEIALELMMARAEGMRDGFKHAGQIPRGGRPS